MNPGCNLCQGIQGVLGLSGDELGSQLFVGNGADALAGISADQGVNGGLVGLAINLRGQSGFQIRLSNLVLRCQSAQALDRTGHDIGNLVVHILLHGGVRNVILFVAQITDSGGDSRRHLGGSHIGGALGQCDLSGAGIVCSNSDGIAVASHLNGGSAGIKIDLDVVGAIPLRQDVDVGDVIQSGGAGVGVGLECLQVGELLEIANADAGASVNIQIQSAFVGSYIEGPFGVCRGQGGQKALLKRNSSHVQNPPIILITFLPRQGSRPCWRSVPCQCRPASACRHSSKDQRH